MNDTNIEAVLEPFKCSVAVNCEICNFCQASQFLLKFATYLDRVGRRQLVGGYDDSLILIVIELRSDITLGESQGFIVFNDMIWWPWAWYLVG